MKNIFFLIAIFFFGKLSSQTERYIYQTEVNPDTINLVDMKVEKTFLDIRDKKSLFISESKLLKDSLISVLRQQENPDIKEAKKAKPEFPKLTNGKSLRPTFFEYFITKDLDNNVINLVENIAHQQMYYQEDRKLNWEILGETLDYNGYKIQKAITTFGGRSWTAWFAPEIRISDGPYKFSGLPGLILKLEDDKGDYRFSFLKKIFVPNSFSEEIKPDAKKSTRINFQGDKAALRMEISKNKSNESSMNFDHPNGGGRGMRQMNGGFGGGMHNGGRHGMENGMPAQTEEHPQRNISNQNFSGFGDSNPIELSNK